VTTLADLLIQIGIDDKGVAKGGKGIESKMQKTWSGVKAGALAAGAAIGATLMTSLSSALDTEVATDKLAAQLGAEGKEAQDLGATAGSLYAKGFGQSMDEVATAVGAVTTSFDDFGDSDVEKVTEKALNLAKTFELDVPRAAQVAGQAVKSGLAKNATQAMDLLTASMQRVPAAVREDLVDAIDEYGPFMSGIGITGEKAFGLLVKSAEKGMYGIDKTGDALKEFTIRATDMSKASKVGYDALGLSQEDMSRKLLKGGDTGAAAFDKIIDGLVKIKDPVKQSQAALALFGTPLEDLSVQEIPKFLKGLTSAKGGLGDVAGAADRMGTTLNDNAATKLEAFKRAAQSALVEQLAKAIPYIEATFGWLQKNSAWVTPLAVGLGILAAVIGIVTAVTWAWNAALAVNPIAWIVIGIIALIAVIVLVATKTKFFQTIWSAVWGFMKGVGAWFAGPFAGFFVSAWNKITASLAKAKSQFLTVVNFIKNLVLGWVNFQVQAIAKVISGVAKFISVMRALPGKVRGALGNMFGPLWSGFKGAVNRIIGGWNRLQFSIGGGTFAGISFPSMSLGTPDIPYLANGGVTTGPTLAMIGEGKEDEAVIPLSRLPEMAGRDDRPLVVELVPGGESEFRRWVQRTIRVKGPVGNVAKAAR
jgi:phage-related minor tail protein